MSAEEKRGFDLGLAGVKTIIEAHGGYVRVDSELGKGAVFSVVLPKSGKSEAKQRVRGDSQGFGES